MIMINLKPTEFLSMDCLYIATRYTINLTSADCLYVTTSI
jgi:hypothetical protein